MSEKVLAEQEREEEKMKKNMKAVIAVDSWKGSLSSLGAGEAVKKGILRVYPDAEIIVKPVADGGEGTVDALVQGMQGRKEKVMVTGPLGEMTEAEYGITGDGKTAVMEMAAAAGLTLVSREKRNPMLTTTYGVGEMIKDAIEKGCRRFLVGIGGSATNDGGAGMLQALGFGLLDGQGEQIPKGAKGLEKLEKITDEEVLPQLPDCTFRIACDVTNPLCGEQGCSAVYGPQKGADPDMIKDMDRWLAHYAELAGVYSAKAAPKFPGTGAAGGLGFAFLTFTNGILDPGIKIVLEETGLEEAVKEGDIIITGEGCLDGQTAMGKAPAGVAQMAKKYNKPVIAFSGAVTEDAVQCNREGIDAFFPVLRHVCTLEEAMEPGQAEKNLTDTAEQIFRLIKVVKEAGK